MSGTFLSCLPGWFTELHSQAVLWCPGLFLSHQALASYCVCLPKEVERNLQDAMRVCRNVLLDPQLVPGGGASEMAVAHALTEKSKAMTGVEQWPYRAVAQALEVIPRTLIQNCGASTIRLLTSLRVSSFPCCSLGEVGESCVSPKRVVHNRLFRFSSLNY